MAGSLAGRCCRIRDETDAEHVGMTHYLVSKQAHWAAPVQQEVQVSKEGSGGTSHVVLVQKFGPFFYHATGGGDVCSCGMSGHSSEGMVMTSASTNRTDEVGEATLSCGSKLFNLTEHGWQPQA
ncbi:hypothetical protein HPP92_028935 [Vanilla planifolia]|uniref:Uncharacterized protein n=1 Tax=Vanilla planifolia TaxID=51239 RepID=A0A835P927_VANPL|nr:hypothetical protein HPP92_028925 [Vanilla planifolia]KAG0446232.1 hypothetical protein HPP92_028935 [Vanilla planifolia]